MKKVYSILKRITIVGILLSISLIIYIKKHWKNITNEKEIHELVSKIREADTLPKKFYELYKIDNPNTLTNNLNTQIFKAIFYSGLKNPPCTSIAEILELVQRKKESRDRFKLGAISLSWVIESKVTQKECLNWLAQNYDFINQTIGIKQASKKYFGKEIKDLNEKEFASLVVMMRNSNLYNPLRRKELVDQNANELLKKIKISQ